MKILWFTWKDRKNPTSGGAELLNEELAKRLVQERHEVIFIVAGFPGAKKQEIIDGFHVVRVGNRWTVYFEAYRYFKKYLNGWANLVIEEVNTIPFLTQLYIRQKKVLIVYQLCREIWFYQIFFPLNTIGYFLEPVYLWLLRKNKVITISKSTKNDLATYRFKPHSIFIIPVGIELEPITDLQNVKKYSRFTVLSLGTIREMKRTHHQIKAFELAKKKIPELKLKIAGDSDNRYGKKFLKMIENSPNKDDIEYLGKITNEKKTELLQKCHVLLVSPVKEGWGLIVTEAASQGSPAIGYKIDGLRDSIQNNKTGLICEENNPRNLAANIVKLYRNKALYKKLQINAWQWSKEMTFDRSYQEFLKIIVP